ncbi:class IV adenylate cyclase [Actinoplanes sp. NPDC051859]|uniref:class IV adenylate cyclase n=1 Tax=Actinoplanes sp. NPDC051859 TaxID=3363909 RepID=UPI0037B644B6
MEYTEVEQKFAAPAIDALRKAIAEAGAQPRATSRQIDTYYNAPHRDFLEPEAISEWLRIREEDNGGASVNFKRWLPVEALTKTHCDEYESSVTDPEAIRRLLHALDFTEMVKVDKFREEWFVTGDTPVIIAIDTINGFGTFVEFEFKGEAADTDEAIEQLTRFIAGLDVSLGERINRGYPHMMLGRER